MFAISNGGSKFFSSANFHRTGKHPRLFVLWRLFSWFRELLCFVDGTRLQYFYVEHQRFELAKIFQITCGRETNSIRNGLEDMTIWVDAVQGRSPWEDFATPKPSKGVSWLTLYNEEHSIQLDWKHFLQSSKNAQTVNSYNKGISISARVTIQTRPDLVFHLVTVSMKQTKNAEIQRNCKSKLAKTSSKPTSSESNSRYPTIPVHAACQSRFTNMVKLPFKILHLICIIVQVSTIWITFWHLLTAAGVKVCVEKVQSSKFKTWKW
jgi:hypothetical protein